MNVQVKFNEFLSASCNDELIDLFKAIQGRGYFTNALVDSKQKLKSLLFILQKLAYSYESEAASFFIKKYFRYLPIEADETGLNESLLTKSIILFQEFEKYCKTEKGENNQISDIEFNPNPVEMTIYMKSNSNMSVTLEAELFFDGQKISLQELQNIMVTYGGLSSINDKMYRIDVLKIKNTIVDNYMRVKNNSTLPLFDAIKLNFELSKYQQIKVNIDDGFSKAIPYIQQPSINITADLKGYQAIGIQWLNTLKELGFGACLADDMGLGKTIQIIALLSSIPKDQKTLLIVPASLVNNWASEIQKFAPSLKYNIIHPTMGVNNGGNIYITTYGTSTKTEWFFEEVWDLIVIDEAQSIKNYNTKQSKRIKNLKSKSRIALTGTPIENRLLDLWSIFDFLNNGLLGTKSEFSKFVKDPQNIDKLKQIISPFILRRLKTDKSILDLPSKSEEKIYTVMEDKQIELYNSIAEDLKQKLNSSSFIERKGIILGTLTKLKQVCNHPSQYLKNGSYDEADSGKLKILRKICKKIFEAKERVIIFTQFRELTDKIADYLKKVFGHDGLVFHGEIPVGKRKDIVDKFQSDEYVPYMVLSIKAGGVGLNLTKANHVVHFDEWWNPAIENQATDRTYRIGQDKDVKVYKLITKGTIEEKIDENQAKKRALSDDIMPKSNMKWISEMNNEEIFNLLNLKIS